MLTGLNEFLDDAYSRNISLVSYMRKFSDISDKERILAIWTGEVLPYLQWHSSLDKRERWAYLRKYTTEELNAMIDKELGERNHVETLIPIISQQGLAVSKLHTKRIADRCAEDTTSELSTSTSQIAVHLEHKKAEVIELKKMISCLSRDLEAALEYWATAESNLTISKSQPGSTYEKSSEEGKKALDEALKQRLKDLRTTNKGLESRLERSQDDTGHLLLKLAQLQKTNSNLLEDNNALRKIVKEHEKCQVQNPPRMSSQDSRLQPSSENSVGGRSTPLLTPTVVIPPEKNHGALSNVGSSIHGKIQSDVENDAERQEKFSRRKRSRRDKMIATSTTTGLVSPWTIKMKARPSKEDHEQEVGHNREADRNFKVEKEKQDTIRQREQQKTERSKEETERARILLKQKEVEFEILKMQLQLKSNDSKSN
ncbi:hypothetical protein BGZ49_002223 [Haplosporangium sp. Z 27]|nr:hypothetical protein BGZ49_002223 [Haplosporangium sp. Z 27]